MPRKTTDQLIEDLAISVVHGFDERRKQVREEFAAVGERLDRIEFEVSGQDRRLRNLEDRVRIISRKVGPDSGR